MRVWSRGLGRVELAADLKKVDIVYDGKSLYVTGRTEPPVAWEFVVILNPCELWPIMRLVMTKEGGKFLGKYLKLRALDKRQLNENYKEATHTKTGVKPDVQYAPVIQTAARKRADGQHRPSKQPQADKTPQTG
jgi:hypothetical protein